MQKNYISMKYYTASFWDENIRWDRDTAYFKGKRDFIVDK